MGVQFFLGVAFSLSMCNAILLPIVIPAAYITASATPWRNSDAYKTGESLIFRNSAETLVEESGLALDHPVAAKFRSHVLAGHWNRVS